MKGDSHGFTLLEMLLVVALLGALVGFSAPVLVRLQRSSDLQTAQQTLVQSHRRSQQLARSSINDQTWGVKIVSGSIIIFTGANYAARDTQYDEVASISPTIAISGINEVVYDRLLATPNTTGTTTLQSDGVSKTATINAKGTVDEN